MTRKGGAENLDGLSTQEIIDAENLVIDAQMLIQKLLNERDMTRAQLATLTGVSKSRLTQLMGSDANPTLRTLAKIFTALGEKMSLVRCGDSANSKTKWTEEEVVSKSWSNLKEFSVFDDYRSKLAAYFPQPCNEIEPSDNSEILAA